MSGYAILSDIGLMVVTATLLGFVAKKLRQPLLLAYVVAGITLGPLGLGLITGSEEIRALSELGIAFLLFGAGVEISLDKLRGMGFVSTLAGVIQVALTFLLGFTVSRLLGLPQMASVFIGLIVSFSSTMIIIKILSDNRALDTLHGRLLTGILIVQDIIVILVLPFISERVELMSADAFVGILYSGVWLIVIAFLANKFVVPKVLNFAVRSQELLFLTAVSTCFAFMWIATQLHFSIAIGAFIAGMSLSAFTCNMEILGKIKSLRDFFATLFFVSLGMQLTSISPENYLILLGALLAIVVIAKPLISAMIYFLLGYGARVSVTTGMALGQVSEFSFIIAMLGLNLGVFTPELFSVVTIVIIFSILLTPYSFRYNNKVYYLFHRIERKITREFFSRRVIREEPKKEWKDHVVLIGCDRSGNRILPRIGKRKLLIVDYNPDVVESLKERGYNVIFGDAYNEEVRERLFLDKAKMIISTIPDVETTKTLIKEVKKKNKKVIFFARAHTPHDVIELYDAGADIVVIPESLAGEKMGEYIRVAMKGKEKLALARNKHMEHYLREIASGSRDMALGKRVLESLGLLKEDSYKKQKSRKKRKRTKPE